MAHIAYSLYILMRNIVNLAFEAHGLYALCLTKKILTACEADGLYFVYVHKKHMNLAYEAHGLCSSFINKKILTI